MKEKCLMGIWKNPKNRRTDDRTREMADLSGQKGTDSGDKTPKKMYTNREFRFIGILFILLFILLAAYLVWFLTVKSDSFINSPYNKRQDLYAEHVSRGKLKTADGRTIAKTVTGSSGKETRVYPYDNLFAHVGGYLYNGKAGMESMYGTYMLRSHSFILKQTVNELQGSKAEGDTVVSTVRYKLQKSAYDALGDRKGAVVVLQPSTGKVLAMVSKPDFDPNQLKSSWSSIASDSQSSALLNRASQGLYPPGSTFKILTTMEYMREHKNYKDFSYTCNGNLHHGNFSIHCYGYEAHGRQNLSQAFANSCNGAFSTIGLTLNVSKFDKFCDRMLFNQKLPTDIPSAKSRFDLSPADGDHRIMLTAIGQGDTLVSPLHMAMIVSAIDNKGVLYRPYLADRVQNDAGTLVHKFRPEEYGQLMSATYAKRMRTYMKKVVSSGTASALSGQSYHAAGKTGSAEYSGGTHGWFTGYAKKGHKNIAIAVIVENGGSGGKSAVPVAKQVFDTYFGG